MHAALITLCISMLCLVFAIVHDNMTFLSYSHVDERLKNSCTQNSDCLINPYQLDVEKGMQTDIEDHVYEPVVSSVLCCSHPLQATFNKTSQSIDDNTHFTLADPCARDKHEYLRESYFNLMYVNMFYQYPWMSPEQKSLCIDVFHGNDINDNKYPLRWDQY